MSFGAEPSAQPSLARPVCGLVVWLGFEIGIAPVLGRRQAKRHRSVDRLARAADHLLYGWSIGDAPNRAKLAIRGHHASLHPYKFDVTAVPPAVSAPAFTIAGVLQRREEVVPGLVEL